jgi:hypothetical protein
MVRTDQIFGNVVAPIAAVAPPDWRFEVNDFAAFDFERVNNRSTCLRKWRSCGEVGKRAGWR